jgi:hypothetical protein
MWGSPDFPQLLHWDADRHTMTNVQTVQTSVRGYTLVRHRPELTLHTSRFLFLNYNYTLP